MAQHPKKGNGSKQPHHTGVVVAAMLVITAVLVYVATNMARPSGDPNRVRVNVPLIETQLTSAKDGREYTVQALFVVRMDKSAQSAVNASALQEVLTETVLEMDVDTIAGRGGVAYVNQYAGDALNEYLADYPGARVVVTDMAVSRGGPIQLLESPGGGSHASDVAKSLFKNME